jgi:hypothetical protein
MRRRRTSRSPASDLLAGPWLGYAVKNGQPRLLRPWARLGRIRPRLVRVPASRPTSLGRLPPTRSRGPRDLGPNECSGRDCGLVELPLPPARQCEPAPSSKTTGGPACQFSTGRRSLSPRHPRSGLYCEPCVHAVKEAGVSCPATPCVQERGDPKLSRSGWRRPQENHPAIGPSCIGKLR